MAYQVEEINTCTKKLVFDCDLQDFEARMALALKEQQKKANIKGFRQGKVPATLVERYYGPKIKADTIEHFISENYSKAIQETKLPVIALPKIDDFKLDEAGKKIKFNATVEVYPEFKLVDIHSWEFKKDAVKVTDQDVDQAVKQVLDKKAVMQNAPDGTTLANGQFAIIDFTGIKPDGSRPDNMKGTGFSLEIGSHSFVDTFEEQLIGMKVGEERTIEVTFPGDYGAEELRNVKVKFEVKLQEIKNKVFPEIDEEFLKEEGHQDKAAFFAAIRKDLEDGQKRAVEQKLRREVLQRLCKENDFLIPAAMIDQQLKADQDRLRQQYKAYRLPDGRIDDLLQENAAEMRKTAEAEMREALIVNRYAEDAKIEIGDADIDAYIKEVAAKENGDTSYYEDLFKKHPQYKTNIKIMLREQKAVEVILKQVKIS